MREIREINFYNIPTISKDDNLKQSSLSMWNIHVDDSKIISRKNNFLFFTLKQWNGEVNIE